MTGKDKCRILKDIRREIAEKNDIKLITEECRFKGECKGTCPKCEAEVRFLEKELERRMSLGKKIVLTGLVAGIAVTSSACDKFNPEPATKGDVVGYIDMPYVSEYDELDRETALAPSLLGLTEQERNEYIAGRDRDDLRRSLLGFLFDDSDNTDKYCVPYLQEDYCITVRFDKDGKAVSADIEKAE